MALVGPNEVRDAVHAEMMRQKQVRGICQEKLCGGALLTQGQTQTHTLRVRRRDTSERNGGSFTGFPT